ncbi:MAG: hypothetical protein KC657_10005 [Myxococcales bacterium]|nr:hypothetical protein [Myxococcales bacterium]
MSTKNLNDWLLDNRVRDRLIKAGAVSEKDIEKAIAALPDLESHCETISIPQPALDLPEEDDDQDDDDDVVDAAATNGAAEPA